MNRTLLIASVFPPAVGGSGRWFWELYRRLPREYGAIVAGEHPEAGAFDAMHDLALRRVSLHFPDYGIASIAGLVRYRRATRATAQVVLTGTCGSIHCGAILPDGWIGRTVARRLGRPYLVYLHGEELCYTASSRELGWMARRVLRDAEMVVVNSRNTERIALTHWQLPSEKVRLLHPGVNCDWFAPAPRDVSVRQKLGWGERSVILTVGRLQKRKGQDMLIRALPAIRERIPNVLYAIVGDGAERRLLEELAETTGVRDRVLFHGELKDATLLECYQQCDLFVLPNRAIGSDIEGFGMVLVEAQACGKPVIAGASGGTTETMDIGRTGVVVHCEKPAMVAKCVIEFLANPQRRYHMGIAARDWAVQHFDWSRVVGAADGLFQQVGSMSPVHSKIG